MDAMAEPLKHRYGPEVPTRIAAMIGAVSPAFDTRAFLADALAGYEALELMPRAGHIAEALRRHLPAEYEAALDVLMRSVSESQETTASLGLGSFVFLPHVFFVGRHGLDHFEASMRAQHLLTQRFTAEFSIRPYLERHPEATLARLHEWAVDPNEHVRRLVSEGTRPRLPWAPRLREFQRDPAPVLALLERLKDDPSLYVRRSVANNLNDIGKDHPDVLTDTARRWLAGQPSEERRWVVNHALRSAVKRGDPQALAVLGFGGPADAILVSAARITPARAVIGGKIRLEFDLTHTGVGIGAKPLTVLVDFAIHYVKASGESRPKVFKLTSLDLAPGQTVRLGKSVSLAEMTTRKHHPGWHRVEVLLNGAARELGGFELALS